MIHMTWHIPYYGQRAMVSNPEVMVICHGSACVPFFDGPIGTVETPKAVAALGDAKMVNRSALPIGVVGLVMVETGELHGFHGG